MKKILMALAYVGILASSINADVIKVEFGAGAWMQKPKGEISYTDTANSFDGKDLSTQKEKTQVYAWLLFKHPVPIIPNLRLEYANLENKGVGSGKFKDFDVPTTVPTSLKMTQFDVIAYYNLLDNTFWMTLDLGIDVKISQLTYEAQGVIDNSTGLTINYSDSATIPLPLAYLRLRAEIPATSIGLESDIKYVTYNGSTVYDFRAKVDYTLDFVPVVQPAIEIGYRVQKFDITADDDKARIDLEFAGIYAGLMLRF